MKRRSSKRCCGLVSIHLLINLNRLLQKVIRHAILYSAWKREDTMTGIFMRDIMIECSKTQMKNQTQFISIPMFFSKKITILSIYNYLGVDKKLINI